MTDLDLKAIRARCEVAKKTGEWAHWSKDYVPALCDEVERLRSELGVMIDLDVKPYSHSDPFLADVRRRYAPDVWGGADTIPRLLATIDAARARITELEALLIQWVARGFPMGGANVYDASKRSLGMTHEQCLLAITQALTPDPTEKP